MSSTSVSSTNESDNNTNETQIVESVIIETTPLSNTNKLLNNSLLNKKSRDLKEFENQSAISLIVDKDVSKSKNLLLKTSSNKLTCPSTSIKQPEVQIDSSTSNKTNNSKQNVNKISKISINSDLNKQQSILDDEQKIAIINKGILNR